MMTGYLYLIFLLLACLFAGLAFRDWQERDHSLSIAGKTRLRLAMAFFVVAVALLLWQ